MKKCITIILISFFTQTLLAQTALELVKKADQKLRGDYSYSEMDIEIVRPRYTREISLKSWTLGTKYSLILMLTPVKDRGTTFLKRGKEIWNWVPAIDRQIKLPPSMMMQNWMGTDLTNDDLVKESSIVNDYTHEINGEEKIEGYECYKIVLTPKPDAAVVWGKIIIWIDKEDYMQLKTEFYDEDNELINIMNGKDVGILGGKKLPKTMEFIPTEKPGNKTIIKYQSLDFSQKTDESFYTTQNMKRLKP